MVSLLVSKESDVSKWLAIKCVVLFKIDSLQSFTHAQTRLACFLQEGCQFSLNIVTCYQLRPAMPKSVANRDYEAL